MVISPAHIIQKKRDGKELTRADIHGFIKGTLTGDVTDYQATAFLMAVYFQGMTLDETVFLTEAMLESGERYDLSTLPGIKVDKHSTGGVGDKVSLILAPLAAACGLKVPMMSGRGLGHSGGTLDKLESITGFNVYLNRERFKSVLSKVGCAMIGQSEMIAPADRKLYALRDVTATVECIPLIVASILSKKLAEGSNALMLDVKVGSGAFMKSRESARKLAKSLIRVAKKLDLPCRALLTDMNQPLGYAVGNALEVYESIEVLRDSRGSQNSSDSRSGPPEAGSGDLKELTVQLCAHMLELGGISRNLTEGRKLAHARLADGSAWNRFEQLVLEQGGSMDQILEPEKLLAAPQIVTWKARSKGYISRMDTEAIGRILIGLGGGRKKATDRIDPASGMVFHRKLGSRVQIGDPIVTVHAPEEMNVSELESLFHAAVEVSGARKAVPKLILEVVGD